MPAPIVGAACGGSRAAVVVLGVMPRRVVVCPSDLVNVRRVPLSVMESAVVQAADAGERHAPLQGLKGETPANSSLMRVHE
jgi:hypothetical protein